MLETAKNLLYYAGKFALIGVLQTGAQALQQSAREHQSGIIADANRAAEVTFGETTLKVIKSVQGKR